MRIIDAHNHPDWHKHDLVRFLLNAAQYNIEKTWLLSWECPPAEFNPEYNNNILAYENGYPIPFSRCLAYKHAAPDKFVLCYAPDPRLPESIDRLDAAIEIHGVRVYGEIKLRMMYDDLDALRLFRHCGARNLPVLVHLDYEFDTGRKYPRANWWYGGGIEPFERAVQGCPDTIFIGHAPAFWGHISGDQRAKLEPYPDGPVLPGGKVSQMFKDYPNVYADLSAGSALTALSRDVGFAAEFIVEFQDRLLYGRDFFDNRMQEFINSMHLPDAVLRKIYSGNASRLVPDILASAR